MQAQAVITIAQNAIVGPVSAMQLRQFAEFLVDGFHHAVDIVTESIQMSGPYIKQVQEEYGIGQTALAFAVTACPAEVACRGHCIESLAAGIDVAPTASTAAGIEAHPTRCRG